MTSFVFTFPIINNKNCHLSKYLSLFNLQDTYFKKKAKQNSKILCVLHLMPCPFTGPKMFWAGPNFLCQTKNLFAYCDGRKHFVPDKKMICIQ